jgi:hypothetical protein
MQIRKPLAVSANQPPNPITISRPVAPADHTYAQVPTQDTVHFSARGSQVPAARISFSDPAEIEKTEFGSAVKVDASNHKEMNTLLGYFSMTSDQERQIKTAESRAFDRFTSVGYSPERGSIQAKIRQSAVDSYNPGYSVHTSALNITDGEKDQIKGALTKYGEDVASIAITGRNRKDLQRHLEDKFFITIFDRDKEEFQDYFKGGFQNLAADQASMNSLDNNQVEPMSHSSESAPLPVSANNDEEKYKTRYFRPRVGVSMKGLDFQAVKIKPKVDLIQVRGPALTEIRVTAEVPFEFSGKMYPEAEISARRMLNSKPGEYGNLKDNVYAETRAHYNFEENRMEATLGVRKQISPDSSMGMYGLYSQTYSGMEVKDIGIGVNYSSRFE